MLNPSVEKVISCLPLIHQLMFCLIKTHLIDPDQPYKNGFCLSSVSECHFSLHFSVFADVETNESVGVKDRSRIKCFHHLKKC